MVAIPIQSDDVNLKDYWQLRALSVEWLYVLEKLRTSIQAKDADRHALLAVGVDGAQTYLLSKKFYTAPTIAKATGIEAAKLEASSGVITLRGKDEPELPKPTVEYWGEA